MLPLTRIKLKLANLQSIERKYHSERRPDLDYLKSIEEHLELVCAQRNEVVAIVAIEATLFNSFSLTWKIGADFIVGT